METWGYTSYKALGWVNDDGGKWYGAYFTTEGSVKPGEQFSRSYIEFIAHHPIKALREICNSGKLPTYYNRCILN